MTFPQAEVTATNTMVNFFSIFFSKRVCVCVCVCVCAHTRVYHMVHPLQTPCQEFHIALLSLCVCVCVCMCVHPRVPHDASFTNPVSGFLSLVSTASALSQVNNVPWKHHFHGGLMCHLMDCHNLLFLYDEKKKKKGFKVCKLPLPVEKNRIAALEWLFVIS